MAVGEAERKRAVEIGSEGRTSAWTEIVSLLSNPSPAVRRVFGIICPKEAIHRKSIQRWPFHHNEVAVKSP